MPEKVLRVLQCGPQMHWQVQVRGLSKRHPPTWTSWRGPSRLNSNILNWSIELFIQLPIFIIFMFATCHPQIALSFPRLSKPAPFLRALSSGIGYMFWYYSWISMGDRMIPDQWNASYLSQIDAFSWSYRTLLLTLRLDMDCIMPEIQIVSGNPPISRKHHPAQAQIPDNGLIYRDLHRLQNWQKLTLMQRRVIFGKQRIQLKQ